MNELKFSIDYGNYEVYFQFREYAFNGATANVAIGKAMIDEKLIEPVEGTTPTYSGFIVAHAYQFN